MDAIPFEIPEGHVSITFAKDQPEYRPLPAAINAQGTVITVWKPTDEELHVLLRGGSIQLTMMFVDLSKPFTPLNLQVIG